jgi:ParB/RepB/Spo0J family partition protein
MKKQNDAQLKNVPLKLLQAHPQNPRKIERRDVIEAIAAQLREAGEFDPAHALIVRPFEKGYQIISGHNRAIAAGEAGLKDVPAWVRDLDDAGAFMQLILSNAQSELHPLERGEHARIAIDETGMALRAYADEIHINEVTVRKWKYAADVAAVVPRDYSTLLPYMKHLSEIHAALPETWPKWVEQLLEEQWTVDELRDELKRHKAEKTAPEKDRYLIEEWESLSAKSRQQIVERTSTKEFNAQDSTSIEWAQWSWNPVTGCLHNCPYCYARDIAERFYPQKFTPTLLPATLKAPANTNVPARAEHDLGYRNVFVCSMADLFGKWVPAQWIELVLDQVRANPQWNFLFLTKFPIRMAEFEYPPNAWLGTSVDLQARVKNAERAMANVKASVRWLSLEPLIEPIEMNWSIFNWIVIGGASPSSQTPEWRPPRRWIWDITFNAQAAGCAVYHKDNLAMRLRNYPGAVETERDRAPGPFHYLKVIA